eukprot:365586-Chlamydomonas_euryale.AAC.9
MAMLLARAHTGNWDLVALRNAYHGMSALTMGACGHATWKQPVPHVRAGRGWGRAGRNAEGRQGCAPRAGGVCVCVCVG